MAAEYVKPPLGLKPRAIAEQERVSDIFQAILRYMTAGMPIPDEWLGEVNDILTRYSEEKRNGKG